MAAVMQDAETTSEPHKGPAERRGRSLPPIQTTFNSRAGQRLQRPRPAEKVINEKSQDITVGLDEKEPNTKRRTSKGGLLGLFSRSKSAKASRIDGEPEESTQAEDVKLERPAIEGINGAYRGTSASIVQEAPALSVVSAPTTPKLQHQNSKKLPRSKATKPDRVQRSSTAWDPPPLFQAYPQAIKYAEVAAPVQSADAILRGALVKRNEQVGPASKQDETENLPKGPTDHCGQQNLDSGEKKHKREKSGSLPKSDWTRKIYVLVTSGFLLQYAGEGSFDRLPEKIMQLGKDSAAFASDAIPGQHWVLQIAQAADDTGRPSLGRSDSLFAKFGFWRDLRRSVSCFLLVMDSPEEMNSWLVGVRKEIEALGGKKYEPDIGKSKAREELARQLQSKPSRRFLVQRDPDPSVQPRLHRVETLPEIRWSIAKSEETMSNPAADVTWSKSSKRQSIVARHSMDALSITSTTISADQANLDRLRESSRFSAASIEAKTVTTTRESSPTTSPSNPTFTIDQTLGSMGPPQQMMMDRSRRKSLQALPVPTGYRKSLEPMPVTTNKSPRPYSTFGVPADRQNSPSTPNFSAPSFSKRFSQVNRTPSPVTGRRKPSQRAHSDDARPQSTRPTSTVGELPSARLFSPSPPRPQGRAAPEDIISFPVDDQEILGTQNEVKSEDSINTEDLLRTEDPLPDTIRVVPRRFSSLEYALGKLPTSVIAHVPSPHPPPMTALPRVPSLSARSKSPHRPGSGLGDPLATRRSSSPTVSPRKLRRPVSMQVRKSEPAPRMKRISSQTVGTSSHRTSPIKSASSYNLGQQARFHQQSSHNWDPPSMPPPPVPVPAIPAISLSGPEISFSH
ncbi:hypothetical protein MMC09_003573 [Bachmanniomyces sp. S44760]|nr:hypothetical protein [Bachmanniomyces sp. S44760]